MNNRHALHTLPRGMLAVAHRGYSARYPENTLLAQEKALDIGCPAIEADVRRSKDGVFFCQHDETLLRLGGDASPVSELSWEDICGRLPRRPALLAASLRLARERGALALLDVKITHRRDLEALAAFVAESGTARHVVIGVRRIEDMDIFRQPLPEAIFLGLIEEAPRLAEEFYQAGGHILRLWEEDIAACSALPAVCAGRPFWVTAGGRAPARVGNTDAAGLARCKELGAGGLLVNDPLGLFFPDIPKRRALCLC
ncbi:hypothetical protein FACS1894206_02630 [Deltaproteobacteria bacterium]|nr:hypothetical protein FACS1894206_02630 [Deltaproteobacteria bacterium]